MDFCSSLSLLLLLDLVPLFSSVMMHCKSAEGDIVLFFGIKSIIVNKRFHSLFLDIRPSVS